MATGFFINYDTKRLGQLVTQTAHGFVTGDIPLPLYHDGTDWVSAQSDDVSTLAEGVMVRYIDANTFEIGYEGVYDIGTHSLTPNTQYYLSSSVAGDLTTTAPTIKQGILIPIDANNVMVSIWKQATNGVPTSGGTGAILYKTGTGDYAYSWSTALLLTNASGLLTLSAASYPRVLVVRGANTGFEFGVDSSGCYVWNYDNTPLTLATNGSTRYYITETGTHIFGGETSYSGVLGVFYNDIAANVVLELRPHASQSANIFNIKTGANALASLVIGI
jgi:hypothetical protein